jgi:hypothetical protein
MDFEPLKRWTSTFYAIIQALEIAHKQHFGNQETLGDAMKNAREWIQPDCSFNSVVVVPGRMRASVRFRQDPMKKFHVVVETIVKMMIQDLVVLLDELMDQALSERGENGGSYPQSKVNKLSAQLDEDNKWAGDGCLELIAVRNVLCHSRGIWSQKSIQIVEGFMSPPPKNGDKLTIGFAMLFNYRKAIRTFINQVRIK